MLIGSLKCLIQLGGIAADFNNNTFDSTSYKPTSLEFIEIVLGCQGRILLVIIGPLDEQVVHHAHGHPGQSLIR